MNKDDFLQFAMDEDERAELAEIYAEGSRAWEDDTFTVLGCMDSSDYVSVEENMSHRAAMRDIEQERQNLHDTHEYQMLSELLPESQCEDVCDKALFDRVSIAEVLRSIVRYGQENGLLQINYPI